MKTQDKLKTELTKKKRNSLYILVGEERRMKQIYTKRIGDNVKPIKNSQALLRELSSNSLFHTKSVFVLDNDKTAADLDFAKFFTMIKDNIVVMMFDSIDVRKKFFKDAEDYMYEFKKQSEETVAKYVKSLVEISDDLALLIANRCGCDASRVELEVDKLQMMKQPITIELVDQLVVPPIEDVVFDMIKAVAIKKPMYVYSLYEDLKAMKESPVKLVSLLYNQFKQMIQVQGYGGMANRDICAATGLMFWQVDKAKEVLGYFSIQELVDNLLKIQQCEIDIKSGSIETDLAFDLLLLQILGG